MSNFLWYNRLLYFASMWMIIILGNKFLWSCELNLLFALNANKRWNDTHIHTYTQKRENIENAVSSAFYKNFLILFSQNKFHCTNIMVRCNYWPTDPTTKILFYLKVVAKKSKESSCFIAHVCFSTSLLRCARNQINWLINEVKYRETLSMHAETK